MELKTEQVYKKGYNSNCYVIYIIELKVVEVDKVLKEIHFGRNSYVKYVAFKGTESYNRVCCLYANEYRNVKGRFKILYNIKVIQLILIKEELVILKNYLLDVKIRKSGLFIGVKQGVRKHESDIIVIYILTIKNKVHKWLNSFCKNELIKGKNKTISTLRPHLIEENEYIESIREFLIPVIQNL